MQIVQVEERASRMDPNKAFPIHMLRPATRRPATNGRLLRMGDTKLFSESRSLGYA